ncbi:MAG TPA: 2-phospho-L-lactate transferase [Mesorhizobium sp.]|jgi:LPPG:FO 2-phospho-L-lactate transferase|uniref:2-phospho-L-lactate transferase n=1 Tax=Mesorhizobium sp. TaxID=1871066 RepID=UPI002DDD31C3|nr:2-phospho-L-lactate transferase [Mesorhizobium sp.]HEV2507861.1 2-phospho-L-lactate transferase [Mesorhizobium sp.]
MPTLDSNVVLIAGGVGGARMAEGLAHALPDGALTVIANVGDDDDFYGLRVCPDIDTLVYTLSNRIDRKQGWGVADDTVRALDVLGTLAAPTWMKLGDADFGLHIWRSWQLAAGNSLTRVTQEAAKRLGARARILPASDDPVRTKLRTTDGWMDFQPWFVGRRCEPQVLELRYDGVEQAKAGAEALAAIEAAELIVFAPSNPLLSIEPILAIDGFRSAIAASRGLRVGVSPLIGGKAIKGPLTRLMAGLDLRTSSCGIAIRYNGLLDGFVIDMQDLPESDELQGRGLSVLPTDILMRDPQDAERLAAEILAWTAALREHRERAAS